MDNKDRIINVTKNFSIGIVGLLITYLCSFAYRTLFVYLLGVTYLGINGLFSNILSILSLAELGVGATITFSLYKPLALGDKNSVSALMAYFKKVYKRVGITIGLSGLIISPFLNYFIKDEPQINNIYIIYFLFLINTVISYLFSYKRSILIADQLEYINTINIKSYEIIKIFIQLIVLVLTKNYVFTLIVQAAITLISNIHISRIVDRRYSYLVTMKNPIMNVKDKKEIQKKVLAMFGHRIGTIIVFNTDNVLISSFIGIAWVGLYSNYLLIINIIDTLIMQLSQSLIASIGNFLSSKNEKESFELFHNLFLLNFWIYSFSAICLFILLNPFITLWLGTEYLIDEKILGVVITSYYLTGMRQNVLNFRNSLGLYYNDRYKPLVEASINLIVSVILLKFYGIIGVFLGTVISTLTTSFWVEPYILFNKYFKKSSLKYMLKYIGYTILPVILIAVLTLIKAYVFVNTWLSFAAIMIICLCSINGLYLLLFSRRAEFNYFKSKLIHMYKRDDI